MFATSRFRSLCLTLKFAVFAVTALFVSSISAETLFVEEFEDITEPPGTGWNAIGSDSYFSVGRLNESQMSGPGSIALWFDNANPTATYNVVGNRTDDQGIGGTYAAFAGFTSSRLDSGNIGSTFEGGQDYKLTFNYFNRRGLPNGLDFDAELYNVNTGVAVANQSFTTEGLGAFGSGTIATGTIAYTANGSDEGASIGIRFLSTESTGNLDQAAIDNILLTAVPEPSALIVLLSATALVCLRRRRS